MKSPARIAADRRLRDHNRLRPVIRSDDLYASARPVIGRVSTDLRAFNRQQASLVVTPDAARGVSRNRTLLHAQLFTQAVNPSATTTESRVAADHALPHGHNARIEETTTTAA